MGPKTQDDADCKQREEHVVGVDIGGTKTMALVFDRDFKVVGRCRKRTRSERNDDGGSKQEPVEDRVCRIIQGALDDAKVKKPKGIGVGSPGPLDPETGVIIDTPNLAWKNFALGQMLSDRFKAPVSVDNDVNMGTYGEWRFGEIKDCRNVVGVFPGTGIGGALIINGELYRGFSGAAGEVGHMTIEMNGPYCGCGKRGCLEAVASRIAIAEQVAALAMRGDAPSVYETCGADLSKMRSGVLAQAIKDGEKMVEGVVRKAAFYVGVAVSNLVNVLSPEAVLLGGGLVEAMEDLYLEEVRKAMKKHAMPFLRKGVQVVAAKLGDDAVAMGAGMLIVERLRK